MSYVITWGAEEQEGSETRSTLLEAFAYVESEFDLSHDEKMLLYAADEDQDGKTTYHVSWTSGFDYTEWVCITAEE